LHRIRHILWNLGSRGGDGAHLLQPLLSGVVTNLEQVQANIWEVATFRLVLGSQAGFSEEAGVSRKARLYVKLEQQHLHACLYIIII
jgi:hypothetical protein